VCQEVEGCIQVPFFLLADGIEEKGVVLLRGER
jgi:hypothetical protein